MTEGGIITMPDKDVWMTVDEIADMLFVPSAVVFRTIRSIYKNSIAREEDTHGSFRLFPYRPNWNIDVYSLEMVIRLAYAIDSHNSQNEPTDGQTDVRKRLPDVGTASKVGTRNEHKKVVAHTSKV